MKIMDYLNKYYLFGTMLGGEPQLISLKHKGVELGVFNIPSDYRICRHSDWLRQIDVTNYELNRDAENPVEAVLHADNMNPAQISYIKAIFKYFLIPYNMERLKNL